MDEPPRVSETDAARLWKRAAEMQAEAAHRLEARARELPDRVDRTTDGSRDPAFPEDGYEVTQVRDAAREAGIDPDFVDRALAELRHERREMANPPDMVDRMADRLLSGPTGSLVARRVLRGEGRELLAALDRVLTGPGCRLELLDLEGDDPLEGGTLTFKVPTWTGMSMDTEDLAYRAAWVWSSRLLVTIRRMPEKAAGADVPRDAPAPDADSAAAAAAPPAWEVELFMPVRKGRRVNAWGSLATAGFMAFPGGAMGAAAGIGITSALAIPALIAGGVLAVGAGIGIAGSAVGGAGLYRMGWKHGVRQMEQALEATLHKVRLQLRTGGAFAPPPSTPDDPYLDQLGSGWMSGL